MLRVRHILGPINPTRPSTPPPDSPSHDGATSLYATRPAHSSLTSPADPPTQPLASQPSPTTLPIPRLAAPCPAPPPLTDSSRRLSPAPFRPALATARHSAPTCQPLPVSATPRHAAPTPPSSTMLPSTTRTDLPRHHLPSLSVARRPLPTRLPWPRPPMSAPPSPALADSPTRTLPRPALATRHLTAIRTRPGHPVPSHLDQSYRSRSRPP